MRLALALNSPSAGSRHCPKREPRPIPKGGVSGTLMEWAIRRAMLRGFRFANTWARQRFLTEHPARTICRAFAPENTGSPVLRRRGSRSRVLRHDRQRSPQIGARVVPSRNGTVTLDSFFELDLLKK